MVYRKVRAGHGSLHVRDVESENLHAASLELEWDLEKELEEPSLNRFQLECVEHQPVNSSSGRAMDPDLEPIQPTVSPHGRFERLQEDPNYISRFSRSVPKGQWRSGTCLAKYLLAGVVVFVLGLLIGRYSFNREQGAVEPSADTDVLEKIFQGITAEKIQALERDFDSLSDLGEESKVRYIAQRWEELGLKDVQVTNHTALLSYPVPTHSTIVDKISNQCYLPSGARCDQPSTTTTEPFTFAAYSAVGNLEVKVVGVQYGSPEDLRRVQARTNVTSKIALLKLGQAPLHLCFTRVCSFLSPQLSLLAEIGFGGSLLYVDPCDSPFGNKTFGVTLNPGGNPSFQELPRSAERDLTSLLVQPISAYLAKVLLSAPNMGQGKPCILMSMPSASARKIINLTIENQSSIKTVHSVIGYLKGKTNPDRYILVGSRHGSWYEGALADWGNSSAVMTQIIASMTAQTHAGWQLDRTIVFCSWWGTSLGNIGSAEWGKENAVVLQSRAVAYVSLHSPVRSSGSLQSTASPSLLQLASDIQKRHLICSGGGGCPSPNVSSLQTPGDAGYFSNQLGVPIVEFTYSEFPKTERVYFLSEAFFPPESSLRDTLDPAFKLHENIAKITAEAILRLATDPVLPFYPLDIALDVQNKLKDDPLSTPDLLTAAASLRDSSAFFQSELMRPANDPKERDPAHVRMLNDVLRDLEKSFLIPNPPPGFYRFNMGFSNLGYTLPSEIYVSIQVSIPLQVLLQDYSLQVPEPCQLIARDSMFLPPPVEHSTSQLESVPLFRPQTHVLPRKLLRGEEDLEDHVYLYVGTHLAEHPHGHLEAHHAVVGKARQHLDFGHLLCKGESPNSKVRLAQVNMGGLPDLVAALHPVINRSLAIRLRMITGSQADVDIQKLAEFSSDPRGELRSSALDDVIWNILYGLSRETPRFSILKDAQEVPQHSSVSLSMTLICSAISSAEKLVQSGLDLFKNDSDIPQ
ncbi:inactive N-acetylated-alpha-linked acidic dipeptidase-like protein 2 [Myxocyprinus asiaticus]|uniref:inactive N-acetylated-alpha-linked acidic dipeptidase-like protein 2 n=1 Tax=Myxocyprinus asiaticus TaxID=70543 RepID=UPI0022224457|nr:inactive N-acetylated-alpha-linked acidic dipeptidase-like protein 2 [Myxocyprinus asiaticus]